MTYEEAVKGIALGRYRHFKGKEYEVLAIARHSETKEPMVVYRALYNSDIYGDGAVWIRPAAMWNETVPAPTTANDQNGKADALNGQEVKRFTRV